MAAMGCDRRAHYGNVEQPFCGTHGHYGQWPCPDAARVAAALTAAGYGLVADAKREALEEAADVARDNITGMDGSATRTAEDRGYMQRHNVSAAARWLRARAAEMRQG